MMAICIAVNVLELAIFLKVIQPLRIKIILCDDVKIILRKVKN